MISVVEGTVVAYDSGRGVGEVKGRDGRVFPFHCTRIAGGSREIPVGAEVEFRVAPGLPGRWEAVDLRIRP